MTDRAAKSRRQVQGSVFALPLGYHVDMRKSLYIIGSVFLALAVGFVAGRLVSVNSGAEAIQRVVAMSWGDGSQGEQFKALYGAEVFLEPVGDRYSVQRRVWIGRGDDHWHTDVELGVVDNPKEAVTRWGHIEWSDAGLTIGPGDPEPYFMPRAEIERHR